MNNKTYLLFLIASLGIFSSAIQKQRFNFRSGSYKNYFIEDGATIYDGITDLVYKKQGKYSSSITDEDYCLNTKEVYSININRKTNQVEIEVRKRWESEDCKNKTDLKLVGSNIVQYYEIISESKDSLVTELRKEVDRNEHLSDTFEKGEMGYLIWAYNAKLTKSQKALFK